jgi:hypothetical protein
MNKKLRGDVSMFVTIMVVGVMMILLTTITQKTANELIRNRRAFSSQQAFQAANSGLERWLFEFRETGLTNDIPETPIAVVNNVVISYRVSYDGTNKLVSIGSANDGTTKIERALEIVF